MKLQTYESQLEPNAINAQIQNTVTPESMGANQSGNMALSKALNDASITLDNIQKKNELVAVANATTEYNRQMQDFLYNKETGAMNRKGANAQQILPEYLATEQKIRQQILSDYGFKQQDSVNAFNKMADNDATSNIGQIDRYMRSQFEQNALTSAQNYIDQKVNSKLVLDKEVKVEDTINSIKNMMTATAVNMNWDEATLKQKTQEQIDQAGKKILDSSMEKGDYQHVTDLSHALLMEGISKDVVQPYQQKAQQQEMTNLINDDTLAKVMLVQPTYANMTLDQFTNEVEYRSLLAAKQQKAKIMGANVDASRLAAAIGGQETGGGEGSDTTWNRSGSGAYGTYQIDVNNWASWSAEAGIPGAPMNAENQKKVAIFKMGQYIKKFGVKGAIVAWYGGEGTAEDYVKNPSSDAWNRKQYYNGDAYPSINEYIQGVEEKLGGTVGQSADLTEGERDNVIDMAKRNAVSAWNQREKQWQEEAKNKMMDVEEQLREMDLNGATASEKYTFLKKQYGATNNKYLKQALNSDLNAVDREIVNDRKRAEAEAKQQALANSKAGAITMDNIHQQMYGGKSAQDIFKEALDKGITFTQEQMVQINKWEREKQSGTGSFDPAIGEAVDVATGEAGMSARDKQLIKAGAQADVASRREEYIKETGGYPSVAKLQEWARESIAKQDVISAYGSNWFGHDFGERTVSYSPAQMRGAGVLAAYPVSNGWYRVHYNNANGQQTTMDIPDYYFQALMNGSLTISDINSGHY